jgi:hypothetical protein
MIKDIVMVGNSMTNCLRGIYLEGQYASMTRNHTGIVISSNTIDSTTTTTGGGIHAQFVDDISVTGNNVHGSAGQAAYFYGCNRVSLCNNIFTLSQYDAIKIDGDSGNKSSSFKITGNSFKDFNASSTYGIGVRVSNAVNVIVDNNVFDTSHPFPAIYVDSTNDRVRIGRNDALYTFPPNPLFFNGGTNPNKGVVTITAGRNSIHVDNTLAIDGARIAVTQIAPTSGSAQKAVAVFTDENGGGFTISVSVASVDGSEKFAWEIIQ